MNDKKTSVRTLTMLALLVAMSIVFSRVLSISTAFHGHFKEQSLQDDPSP